MSARVSYNTVKMLQSKNGPLSTLQKSSELNLKESINSMTDATPEANTAETRAQF